jgi:Ca-activated chloride channel family protein
MTLHRSALLAAMLLGAAGGGTAAQEAASPLPRSVVVIDASSSMWTEMEGSDRIGALKSGLAKVLPDYAGRLELGVAVFGNRRKSNCSDVEVLLSPVVLDPAQVVSAIDRLKPRGKAPITLALQQAVDQLAGPEGKAEGSVLLVVDGADNCRQDPCALAAELAAAHPGLSIHVAGIAASDKDMAQLQCIANAGRGTITNAETPGALETALAKLLDRVSVPPVPPEEIAGPPALRLAARLGKDGPALGEGLTWRIVRLDSGGTSGEEVYAGQEPAPRIEVPPGQYLVEATAGPARSSARFEVKEKGTTPAEVMLDAGILSMRALAGDGATELQGVYFTLYRTDEAGNNTDTIAVARDAFPRLVLLPGTYRAQVEHGLAIVEKSLVLGAGLDVREDVVLHVGKLRLEARSTSNGTPLEDVVFTITVDDPAAPGGRREVARSAASNPVFTLRAGLYHVHVRLGAAEARIDSSVRAGQETSEAVFVAAARLSLSSRLKGSTQPILERVRYRIDRLDEAGNADKELASTSAAAPSFDLPAGRYLVTGRLGGANAEQRIEIELQEGRAEEIAVEHEAGEIALSARDASGETVRNVFWEVLDDEGQSIWSSAEPEPRVPLQPGSYRLEWQSGARRGSEAISLAAGEARTVQISTE